jgi:hypothetical protein
MDVPPGFPCILYANRLPNSKSGAQLPLGAVKYPIMNTPGSTPLLRLMAMLCTVGGVTIGCSQVQDRSYQVSVRNQSATPVTVWLTKDGPLYERDWRSPEDLAIESRNADEMIAGAIVKPGETATVGPLPGKFMPTTNAILRVYHGQHNFSGLLAISKGSPDRREFELTPGENNFTVRNDGGILLVERGSANGPPGDASTR